MYIRHLETEPIPKRQAGKFWRPGTNIPILVAPTVPLLLLLWSRPLWVPYGVQPQLSFLGNKPNTPETGSRRHSQPTGTGSTRSWGVFMTYQCWDCFENSSPPLKTKVLFWWIWLTSCITLLFRKTSANTHTSSTFHLAVYIGSRIIANGLKSGFYNIKWHHISRSKEALGIRWISWMVETKSKNLFLWLWVKTSPDINRKRQPIWNRKTYLLHWCLP